MKFIKHLVVIFIALLLTSCSMVSDPIKKVGLGGRVVNYQGDDTIDSLVIPPDLTKPNSQGLFVENLGVTDKGYKVTEVKNVEVKRDAYRRWLLVDMPPSEVWSLSKEFFRSFGFNIEKENQKIGILETDYLEIDTKVPDKSLGAIRAMLSKALKTQYGLPIADKYRIRIESLDDPNQSEVYLTLTSIGEVVKGEQRLWQSREKDVELETEMLLNLMVFLGSDRSEAINKIQASNERPESPVSVVKSESGYATLVFPYNKKQAWSYLGWALDELYVDIEDRDAIDGSYYIKVTAEKGFFSKLLSIVSPTQTYQLIVKQLDESHSQVIFVDLSEENEQDTIDYSFDFFNQLATKF
jgi:outer membrane protein assembly factor BamC